MSAVVIANRSESEAANITRVLGNQHDITVVTAASAIAETLDSTDLLILDANMSDAGGMDVLMKVAKAKHLPILMIVPANEPECAVDAVRYGAFNYVVKVADYVKLLPHAVLDALSRFYERDEVQRTIASLKARIAELEALCVTPQPSPARDAKPLALVTAPQPKSTVLAEVLATMRQGEINLPVYPRAVAELRRLVETQASLPAIAGLLEHDVAIAGKLIGISNSAYYRGSKENSTLTGAIGRLGLKETCNIVELLANRSLYAIRNPDLQIFLPSLWTHAVACAHAAKISARHLEMPNADSIFTMGLLHDIGSLLLLQIVGEMQLRGALKAMDPIAVMEFAHEHHCKFGSEILKRWKLPVEIANVVLCHESISDAEAMTSDTLIVNFADTLVSSMGYAPPGPVPAHPQESAAARLLKLEPIKISEIKVELRRIMSGCDFSV